MHYLLLSSLLVCLWSPYLLMIFSFCLLSFFLSFCLHIIFVIYFSLYFLLFQSFFLFSSSAITFLSNFCSRTFFQASQQQQLFDCHLSTVSRGYWSGLHNEHTFVCDKILELNQSATLTADMQHHFVPKCTLNFYFSSQYFPIFSMVASICQFLPAITDLSIFLSVFLCLFYLWFFFIWSHTRLIFYCQIMEIKKNLQFYYMVSDWVSRFLFSISHSQKDRFYNVFAHLRTIVTCTSLSRRYWCIILTAILSLAIYKDWTSSQILPSNPSWIIACALAFQFFPQWCLHIFIANHTFLPYLVFYKKTLLIFGLHFNVLSSLILLFYSLGLFNALSNLFFTLILYSPSFVVNAFFCPV